jgi:hypothetical protein
MGREVDWECGLDCDLIVGCVCGNGVVKSCRIGNISSRQDNEYICTVSVLILWYHDTPLSFTSLSQEKFLLAVRLQSGAMVKTYNFLAKRRTSIPK